MKTLNEILDLLHAHWDELSEQHKVKSLGIFGSYARGEAKPESDLDLLVEFEESPSLFQFLSLERRLSELLGVEVELVTRAALKPRIGQHILEEMVLV